MAEAMNGTENEASVKTKDDKEKTNEDHVVDVQSQSGKDDNTKTIDSAEKENVIVKNQEKVMENEKSDKLIENKENQDNIQMNSNENASDKNNADEDENVKKSTEKEIEKKEKANVKDDNKPQKVDLKLVKTSYKPHTKSTLPHILTEYGFDDPNNPQQKKDKQKKKKKKKIDDGANYEEEEKHKKKARDEKFRLAYGDNRQSDQYYMEYIDFLEKKVINERIKAQKQREEEARLAALLDEEEKQKRHHVRKLERVELKHDDSFLQNLPKTDIARIVALQDRLKKEGKLKNQDEVDQFWKHIRKPDVFYKHFKVAMQSDNTPFDPSQKSSDTDSVLKPDMAPRSLSHISEASRTDKEPWAITQKFQSTQKERATTAEKPRKNSTQLAKEAALDLERRCPKLEMPPLACFSLKLGEKPPDPEEIRRRIELKQREKSRKKFQRKLNKMYQMAMTHTAAANRILAQHGDLTAVMEGGTLRDVRDFCCQPRELAVFDEPTMFDEPAERYTVEDYYRDLTDPSRQVEVHPGLERGSSASRPSTRHSSAQSHKLTPISDTAGRPSSKSKQKKISLEMIEYPAPLPLSIDEVVHKEKTMEAKCLSTNWVNYMHAGKSVFSTT